MVGNAEAARDTDLIRPASIVNAKGRGPYVIAVDHASNRIPPGFGDLGLGATDRVAHTAWDPGALAVALRLVDLLDATLVQSTVSRLVIDCNRDIDAPDLIPTRSEQTEIPGNAAIGAGDRLARIARYHAPFHAAIDGVLARRAADEETILICMHSFTPSFRGVARPWPIGLVHGRDQRHALALKAALQAEAPELNIGWNEPYSGLSGVTFTLEHHGDGRGLDATMIEIRNDEILSPAGADLWAARLARCLDAARMRRPEAIGATAERARHA